MWATYIYIKDIFNLLNTARFIPTFAIIASKTEQRNPHTAGFFDSVKVMVFNIGLKVNGFITTKGNLCNRFKTIIFCSEF